MTRAEIAALDLAPFDEKLRREVKRKLFWSKFMGNVSRGEDFSNDPELKPSGKPIEVNMKLRTAGIGDRLLIPLQKSLAGKATYGDATLIGREENNARVYAKVGYNQVRHGVVTQKGQMDYTRERIFNAIEYSREDLSDWHANMENFNIVASIYEGVSESLSVSASSEEYGQGLGLPRRWHPNMYTFTGASDAAGVLTKIGSAGKCPSQAEVYSAATSSTTGLTFTTNTVAKAQIMVNKLGMKPYVLENGFSFYPWIITWEQADTLMRDTVFLNAINSVTWKDAKDHPLVNGAIGYYRGFVFYVDAVSVRGFSGSSNTTVNILGTIPLIANEEDKQNPRFLPQEGQLTSTVSGTARYNNVSIIFGASFLGKALDNPLEYKTEAIDYENWKGLAARTTYGYERLDFVPGSQVAALESTEAAVAAMTGVYNRSSALVMTFQ